MSYYRKRCYQNYISKNWGYTHSLSWKEYNLSARVYKKRFDGLLPEDKDAKIIDIGCGAGHFLYFLQKEGYRNTMGIDLSEEQIEAAKKKGLKKVEQADFFQFFPKYRSNFDMIIANDIIEHLNKEEVLKFLDMIYDSLVPGGQVLISTLNTQSLFGAATFYIDFTHETGYTPVSFYQIMRACNFENIIIYGEKPIIYDLKSAIRALLWWCLKKMLKVRMVVERGTGRGMWKRYYIFEPRIFAIARKTED